MDSKNTFPSVLPIVCAAMILSLIFSAAAWAQPTNLGTATMDQFIDRTTGWWPILQGYAITIFKYTATLEVCLFGIRMVMQKSQLHEIVGQFVLVLLFMCFIAAVIMNYKEWAEGIAITGLKPIVAKLGSGPNANAGSPVAMIFVCLEAMSPVLKDADIWDFGMVMVYVFCMGSIIAVFAIICCRYIIVVCEFYIVANAGVLLIGLGGSKLFKEYAFNVMKYVLSVGIKLFVFQLILNMGFSILSLESVEALGGQSIKNISLYQLVVIIIQGAILLGLSWTLPQTCAGILSGANVDGGNPIMSMGGSVAKHGMNMVKGSAQKAGDMRMAHKVAKESGVKGMANTYRHMRQSMQGANMAANPTSIRSQLSSQFNAAKADNALKKKNQANQQPSSSNATSSASAASSAAKTGDPIDMSKASKLN